jgi:transposase
MSDRVQGNWQTDEHMYRRMELTTGTPRRRSWTLAEKARIVAESYSGDRPVAEVALRHSIHRNQIYNWRRELAEVAGTGNADGGPFVPVRVTPSEPVPPAAEPGRHVDDSFAVEVAFADASVRVRDGADGDLVRTVLAALSAAR